MKNLRIAVLGQEASPTLTGQIRPVALARGHTMDVLSIPTIELSRFFEDKTVQSLLTYDVVYYRTGLYAFGSLLLERWLHEHGIPTVNFHLSKHPYVLQKCYQTTLVAAAGIRTPKTVLDISDSYVTLVELLGTPFVAKGNESAQGRDVFLVRSEEEFTKLVPMREEKALFYQEYIEHERDYRMHVVGNEVVWPYCRTPPVGDFRANVSRGGTMAPIPEDEVEEVSGLALRVAALFGHDVCAVDFLPGKRDGYVYFTEINENPGWLGVSEVLGGDPSSAVVDLFEQRALEGNK